MNRQTARQTLAVALVLTAVLTTLAPPYRAVAGHLPPPAEFVVRPGDLPPGLEPVQEAGGTPMLPDGLARQAAVSFRRDPAQASEPGVRYVRQVVLAFDDREAVEYVPRFRDLMVRHQGYTVLENGESEFRLARTRSDETSIIVGSAHGEVLVVTTVAGLAGTVGPDDAERLSQIAVARVPTVDQSSAALSTGSAAAALGAARPGPGALDLVNQQDAVSYPQPVLELPRPPDVDVVQVRNGRAVGDRSLDALLPEYHTGARPTARPVTLAQFMSSLGPLLDQFWGRVLSMTNITYVGPTLVVIPAGGSTDASCLVTDGEPVLVRGLTYCPANRTVYAYESFFKDEVLNGRDWQSHEITVAALMARTWGHHIQLFTNMIAASNQLAENQPDLGHLITRQRELEANCYAGLFTRYAREKGWLQAGDLEEARASMVRASDVDTDQFATPEQRKEWFMRGYVHYAFRICDAW